MNTTMDLMPAGEAWTPEMRERIHLALRAISARCDGARTDDAVGFSGVDAGFGNTLARLPLVVIDDASLGAAYVMLRKYRRQLLEEGIDYDTIPRPPETETSRHHTRAVVRRPDGDFDLVFDYDPALVELVRRLPGRTWDRDRKRWSIPGAFADDVYAFAATNGFRVDHEHADPPPTPTASPARGSVTLEHDELVLAFPYSKAAMDLVRALPGRHFEPDTKRWRVPAYLVRRVRRIAEDQGWAASDEVAALPDIDPDKPPVTCRLVAGLIEVRFAFHPHLTTAMRQIPGAVWSREKTAWLVPMHQASVLVERLEAKTDLDAEGVHELVAELNHLLAASRAMEADIDLPDTLGLQPFPFQKAGVAYVMVKRRSFIADEVGLGKTISSLAAAETADAFPLVIFCPPTLIDNWAREIHRVLPHRTLIAPEGVRSYDLGGGMFGMPDIVLLGYSQARGWAEALAKLNPRGVICDESHLCKESNTQRTQAVQHVAKAVPRDDGLILCLSATPVLNHRREFAPQLEILGRLAEFGGTEQVKHMWDINERLRAAGCFIRRTKDQVLPELPAAIHNPVYIEPDPHVMVEYQRAEKDLLNYLAERAAAIAAEAGLDPRDAAMEAKLRAGAAEHLVAIGVLKRIAAHAKLNAVKAWVEQFLAETGKKFLLFGHSLDVLGEIRTTFGCPTIQGETPMPERQRIVDRFQNEADLKLLTLGLQAGGVGLTLTAADTVGFIELGWTPGIHDQAIGRTYGRLNDPHGAIGHYFIAKGTIDHRIVDLLDRKRAETMHAIDGIDPGDEAVAKASILGDLVVALTEEALNRG